MRKVQNCDISRFWTSFNFIRGLEMETVVVETLLTGILLYQGLGAGSITKLIR